MEAVRCQSIPQTGHPHLKPEISKHIEWPHFIHSKGIKSFLTRAETTNDFGSGGDGSLVRSG